VQAKSMSFCHNCLSNP